MKLREIKRTATFAWSPGQHLPLIVTGTVAGALDASFSNTSKLEIFQLNLQDQSNSGAVQVAGSIDCSTRFNRLAWGNTSAERPFGIIAGGMDNGELALWNAAAILENGPDTVLMRKITHSGAVRGLDFNPFQTNLLASAAGNGEIFIWDVLHPENQYSPGTRSPRLDDITCVSWNYQVQHILATSSTTGSTVVWDLRSRREVMHLHYPGAVSGVGMVGAGARRGITAVAWNPDTATQLVTASEDDTNPAITMWDLRNAHSPEKILTGHTKGILSLSWCQKDSDLLLSTGKDCRTLCWNPRTGEIIGELPVGSNWGFDVDWCPRNPDLLASSSFDGTISVHSLSQGIQADQSAAFGLDQIATHTNDPFAYGGQPVVPTLSLKQPPKWLRRPVGATFAFGGKLVTFNNKSLAAAQAATANTVAGAPAAPQQPVTYQVTISTIATEPELVQRSVDLEGALIGQDVQKYIESRKSNAAKSAAEVQSWGVLWTLFEENAREKLMKHLGFEKEEVMAQINTAINDLSLGRHVATTVGSPATTVLSTSSTVVTGSPKSYGRDIPLGANDLGIVEPPKSGLPGLFGASSSIHEDLFAATPMQIPEQIDPFSIVSPHSPLTARTDVVQNSFGNSPFKIYPKDESNVDHLITRSIVLGDFESAVNLSLQADRLSDALLLAICGGAELLARTQKAYFESQAPRTPYLRLLQSIVNNDLSDVVNNAALDEWTEVIAVLCTFAKPEDFGSLCEVLGDRLDAQWRQLSGPAASIEDKKTIAAYRRNATMCYLASGNLEKVVSAWVAELYEEIPETDAQYSHHAKALQCLIEKVAVFCKAIGFVDPDLIASEGTAPRQSYKLTMLYDKYLEYAELMVSQGRLSTAQRYLSLTPPDYAKMGMANQNELAVVKDRVYRSSMDASNTKIPPFPFEVVSVGVEGQLQVNAANAANAANAYGAGAHGRDQTPLLQQTYEPVEKQQAYDYNYNTTDYPQQPTYQNGQPTYQNYQAQPGYQPSAYQPSAPQGQQQFYHPTNQYAQYQNQTQQYPFGTNQYDPATTGAQSTIPNLPQQPPVNTNLIPATQRRVGNWNDPPTTVKSPNLAKIEQVKRVTSPFPNQPGPVAGSPIQPGYGLPAVTGSPAPPPTNAVPPSPLYKQPLNQQPGYVPQAYIPKAAPTPPLQYPNPYVQQAQYQQPYQTAPSPQQAPAPRVPTTFTATQSIQETTQLQEQERQAQIIAQAAAQPAKPPAPPIPEKKRHSAGDRSHIPDAHNIIFKVLTNEWQRFRQTIPPNQKKVLDDTEKRVNTLFDALNNEDLSSSVAASMVQMAQALEAHDYSNAQRIQLELVTTKYDEAGHWLVGVKRLIEQKPSQ